MGKRHPDPVSLFFNPVWAAGNGPNHARKDRRLKTGGDPGSGAHVADGAAGAGQSGDSEFCHVSFEFQVSGAEAVSIFTGNLKPETRNPFAAFNLKPET